MPARLPVAEHALPPVARPVTLVSVEVAALVEGISSLERGGRSSAGPEDDLAWAESVPRPVPAAVSLQAGRERLPQERDGRSSAGLEGDPARAQPALLGAVVGLVAGAREGRSGRGPDR